MAEKVKLSSPVGAIDAQATFDQLELKEKLYTYHFSRASWEGCKIAYFQRSYESPVLLYLLGTAFSSKPYKQIKADALNAGLSEEEWKFLEAYAAGVFCNCGNYFSYGDNKFVPEISSDKFLTFLRSTEHYKTHADRVEALWKENQHEIYTAETPLGQIGFPDQKGSSAYYSANCTSEDNKLALEFFKAEQLIPLNTFLVKLNKSNYLVLVSCADAKPPVAKVFGGARWEIQYGFLGSILTKVSQHLLEAQKVCATEEQKQMLTYYVKSFDGGSMEDHRDSQRWWIKDRNPVIETNIGFVETYLDPSGTRAEWEGFVAIVDKLQSKLLAQLVEGAEPIIATLPWGKHYEVDAFKRPDFTSLQVVTFASSGTPIGINIPNYEDIRMNDGFKNVNLGNVVGTPKRENLHHLPEEYKDLLIAQATDSLFVDVSCHELLGHGTGKILHENADGTFNFNPADFSDWNAATTPRYRTGETWRSKFGGIASGWEECRAESVALYLAVNQTVLETLVPGKADAYEDIIKAVWIHMVYGGIKGLTTYSTDKAAWGQAHCNARFAIYKVLREHKFVDVQFSEKDGRDYFTFTMNVDKIRTDGVKIMGDFLIQLQRMKSHGDIENGKVFWEKYSALTEEELRMRKIVIDWKAPRPLEVQHDLELLAGDTGVKCHSYAETFQGLIESTVAHYRGSYEDVYQEYQLCKHLFRPDTLPLAH